MTEEYDILIRNAIIVKGTGEKPFTGSIGLLGDKVSAVGDVRGDAKKEIDATGLTAVPGFIDAHSHNDTMILWYPKCESYVMQGVTTFIGGQCGGSPAPLGDEIGIPGRLGEYLMEFVPHKYRTERTLYPKRQVNEWMKQKFGWTIDWTTMGEFFDKVEKTGISMNYAPLVGHGTIRTLVMGENYKRHSTKVEQAEMKGLIQQAMEEGCIGMSAGLDYDPDVFADTTEIHDHVSLLKDYRGIYCPHWRRTGRRRDIGMGFRRPEKIAGIHECIETSRVTGVPVHFAHLTTGWYTEPTGSDLIDEANIKSTLEVFDRAREEGIDATYDVIPFFVEGGFSVLPYLCSLLVPWLRELGSREALARWLKVPDFREEVKEAISKGKIFWYFEYNPNTNPRWAENIKITKCVSPDCDWKLLAQIASQRRKDPMEVFFDLITEDPDTRGVVTAERAGTRFELFYKNPAGMVGLDTSARYDKLQAEHPPYSIPGINTFSAFPIFFKKYVNEEKIFTVEEAVQKTSTSAARVHGLKGRGIIDTGCYADIVLMDLPGLQILGDPVEPRRYPRGIEYVLVNGVPVVEAAKHTMATPGHILKKTRD